MATIRDKTVIDIIPVIDGGDVKKIYDHGVTKINQIILGVFNQLNMERGTLDDFPDIGCVESLLKLYFNDTTYTSLSEIRDNFRIYQNKNINCDIIINPSNPEDAQIIITVDDIPNLRFTADILNKNQNIKIVNPVVTGV